MFGWLGMVWTKLKMRHSDPQRVGEEDKGRAHQSLQGFPSHIPSSSCFPIITYRLGSQHLLQVFSGKEETEAFGVLGLHLSSKLQAVLWSPVSHNHCSSTLDVEWCHPAWRRESP